MKKIIKMIITISVILSSLTPTFASEGFLEILLDLNHGIEEHDLELAKLDNIHFKKDLFNNVYNEFKKTDKILRKQIINNYRSGKFKYYQTQGIIKNYKNFIYHANRFFYYLKIEENHPNYVELDSAILRSYKNIRRSYRNVKNIIKR